MASTYSLGPCGGAGGNVKSMNIDAGNRILKVQIRHAGTVDALQIIYRYRGSDMSTDRWGGDGGSLSEFNLDDDEFLTSIRGHYGPYEQVVVVRSITFVSNKRSYGPFGTEEGIPFNLEASGGKIIGFAARSGGYLDSVAVHATHAR